MRYDIVIPTPEAVHLEYKRDNHGKARYQLTRNMPGHRCPMPGQRRPQPPSPLCNSENRILYHLWWARSVPLLLPPPPLLRLHEYNGVYGFSHDSQEPLRRTRARRTAQRWPGMELLWPGMLRGHLVAFLAMGVPFVL